MSPIPSTARAAVFRAVKEPQTIEIFSIPALKGSEVLVKIRLATICGSDLHSYQGRRHAPTPSILGHEMVGNIAALGPLAACDFRGNELKLDDRVTWSMVWSCGECFYCQHGMGCKCVKLMKFGHEAIVPGRALIGGLAEYCHLPEKTAIFKVPANVSDAAASPANCATATVAAVFRHAGLLHEKGAGKTVVIHGAGMLGQTACAMAAVGGANNVIILEPDACRRENALRFGATLALDNSLSNDAVRAHVLHFTEGRGADVGIELSGFPDAVERGLGLLRMGGRFVMAGATFPSRAFQFSAEQIVKRMLQIVGVYNYQPEDLETALDFLAKIEGLYPFDELVGKTFPLSEVNAAFEFAKNSVHLASPFFLKEHLMTAHEFKPGVQAVIFDISGTVLDYGSRGPVMAFIELFRRHGVTITQEEMRRPMGTHKRDHIREMLADRSTAERREKANGNWPHPELMESLYEEFTSLQKEVLKRHCDVIPGVPAVVKELRARGIKIANTTGFDSGMMTDLIKLAARGGYEPDLWVTPDQVGQGRPAPWMIFYAARQLDIYPLRTFVKVGDTTADVAEGHAAGVWVVSVVHSGNEVGHSQDELARMADDVRKAKFSAARAKLAECGPHYIINTTADLIPVIDDISARIVRGERP